MEKNQNNVGNKKRSILQNIVSKFTKASKSITLAQKDLFNPELFLTINKIKERFGNDAVCFGDQLSNFNYDKLLNSNDINLLKTKADELLKNYQQIDKQLITLSKAYNTNSNIYKRKQLEKQKEKTKQIYISIRQKIKTLYYNK